MNTIIRLDDTQKSTALGLAKLNLDLLPRYRDTVLRRVGSDLLVAVYCSLPGYSGGCTDPDKDQSKPCDSFPACGCDGSFLLRLAQTENFAGREASLSLVGQTVMLFTANQDALAALASGRTEEVERPPVASEYQGTPSGEPGVYNV